MKPVVFSKAALADFREIGDHYAAAELTTADRWLRAFQKLQHEIQRRPTFGTTAHGERLGIEGLRHRQVPRFPYVVFYVERTDSVSIVRVLHERRDLETELDE